MSNSTARTTIPRWTANPVPGTAECDAPIPDGLQGELLRLAGDLGVSLSTMLLAAHVKVLATLTGESDVTIGYVASGGDVLPCRLTTTAESWRELILITRKIESELPVHHGSPSDQSTPAYEIEFDPTGLDAELADTSVLRLTVSSRRVHLRYRTRAIDADYAARIMGYYLAAIAFIAADPEVEHARQSLLSEAELRHQIHGLAGPRRALPDRRFHELFEANAARQPDAVAAIHGDQQCTYAELNGRANRLARALLARGLRPEDVVGVVTERNLDWLTAVLAIFKAGGAYLPIEPHFLPIASRRCSLNRSAGSS